MVRSVGFRVRSLGFRVRSVGSVVVRSEVWNNLGEVRRF